VFDLVFLTRPACISPLNGRRVQQTNALTFVVLRYTKLTTLSSQKAKVQRSSCMLWRANVNPHCFAYYFFVAQQTTLYSTSDLFHQTMKYIMTSTPTIATFVLIFLSGLATAAHAPSFDHLLPVPDDDDINLEEIWDALTLHAEMIVYQDERTLEQDDDPTTDLVGFACDRIEVLLGGPAVSCDCSLSFSISYSCTFDEEICLGGVDGFCARPLVTGTLGLLDSTIAFEFCTVGATNGGNSVPGLCITFGRDALGEEDDAKGLSSCSAAIGGLSCSSCEMCADGKGYVFDCSAHEPGVMQSECTAVSVVESLTQQHYAAFLPNLD